MQLARKKINILLNKWFGLDYRSLAFLRMGIGLTIFLDLLQRASDLRAHYTDSGVLPRAELFRLENMHNIFSIHTTLGETWFITILFIIAGIAALSLIVGYRTRLAVIISWILLVSIQARNPAVLQGGDIFLHCVLFFMLFLPLNRRWSLDRLLNKTPSPKKPSEIGLSTVAYVLQIVLLYLFTGLLKTGTVWHSEATAVYYALSIDQLTTGFGHWLLGIQSVLPYLTRIVWYVETFGAILLFIPWRTWIFRLSAIVLFTGLQIGFNSSFRLGYFGLIAITATFGLLPSEFWDICVTKIKNWFEKRAKQGLTIVYDTDCSFCAKASFLIKRLFCLSLETQVISSSENQSAAEIMERENSWVIIDANGNARVGFSGFITILTYSPWAWIFTPIFSVWPIKKLGEKIYRLVANNRKKVCIPEPLEKKLPVRLKQSKTIFIGMSIACILVWNAISLTDRPIPEPFYTFGRITRLDQAFNMFAPYPPFEDGWYVMPGTLRDGTIIDTFNKGMPVIYLKPDNVAYTYKNQRWQKYFMNLWLSNYSDFRLDYGKYVCRSWNSKHTNHESLTGFSMIFMLEKTPEPGMPLEKAEPVTIWTQECF